MQKPTSPALGRPLQVAGMSLLLATLFVYCLPECELQVFARVAASLSSLFTGAPVFQTEGGWVLPILNQPVLINEACSGSHFFMITTSLLGWHLPAHFRHAPTAALAALSLAWILTGFFNSLRIVCLAQVHYWILPRLPENYAAFIHMLTGLAIFLPALITLNIALDLYAKRRFPGSPA